MGGWERLCAEWTRRRGWGVVTQGAVVGVGDCVGGLGWRGMFGGVGVCVVMRAVCEGVGGGEVGAWMDGGVVQGMGGWCRGWEAGEGGEGGG